MASNRTRQPIIERLAERISEDIPEPVSPPWPSEVPKSVGAGAESSATVSRLTPPAKNETIPVDLKAFEKAGMVTPEGGQRRIVNEYRNIKRPILRNAADGLEAIEKRRNLVMVTSAHPGEGKTFTAISLAMSVVSELNTRVLLVDLDLAKQDLRRRFGAENHNGLLDALEAGQTDPTALAIPTTVPGLEIITAGHNHPLANELLAGPRMSNLVDEWARQYRNGLVIFDTPPMFVSTDAKLLASYVGQTLLVVQARRTRRPAVEECVNMLADCELIYLVLNRASNSELADQYGTHYAYGRYGR